MDKRIHLPHPNGINNINYFMVNPNMIQAISDYEIGLEEMHLIEQLLNVDLRLGIRQNHSREVNDYGKIVTTWWFLTAGDCDWS